MSKPLPEVYFKLYAIREYLSDPERWVKHAFRFEGGKCLEQVRIELAPCDMMAACLIERAIADVTGRGANTIAAFNDRRTTTHAVLMQVLDRAVELGQKHAQA
jgi:hypothetical protein